MCYELLFVKPMTGVENVEFLKIYSLLTDLPGCVGT